MDVYVIYLLIMIKTILISFIHEIKFFFTHNKDTKIFFIFSPNFSFELGIFFYTPLLLTSMKTKQRTNARAQSMIKKNGL